MTQSKILDIAHISFLDTIRSLIAQSGPASAKGTLVRTAIKAGEGFDEVDFSSFDDFVKAIDSVDTPMARIEGKAVHLGDGLFGLPKCPFADSIANYKEVFKSLPDGYGELTKEFNKPGRVTGELEVGHGAGVSPFCSVHQPLRSTLGDKVTIGEKPIAVYQLGCKAGDGKKGLAEELIAKTDFTAEQVEAVLDDHMCCYAVTVEA
jgi:hypothetical protein